MNADTTWLTAPPRPVLPELNEQNADFWSAGGNGRLAFTRCQACRRYIHPSAPICDACRSREVALEPVSGRGVVLTFTVNRQPWVPAMRNPFVLAIVELVEQHGLHVTTNIVNCELRDVRIGLAVRVLFEQCENVWIPVFEPLAPLQGAAPAPGPVSTGAC